MSRPPGHGVRAFLFRNLRVTIIMNTLARNLRDRCAAGTRSAGHTSETNSGEEIRLRRPIHFPSMGRGGKGRRRGWMNEKKGSPVFQPFRSVSDPKSAGRRRALIRRMPIPAPTSTATTSRVVRMQALHSFR